MLRVCIGIGTCFALALAVTVALISVRSSPWQLFTAANEHVDQPVFGDGQWPLAKKAAQSNPFLSARRLAATTKIDELVVFEAQPKYDTLAGSLLTWENSNGTGSRAGDAMSSLVTLPAVPNCFKMRLPLLFFLFLAILANCQEEPAVDECHPVVDEEASKLDDQSLENQIPSDPEEPLDEAGDPDGPPDQPGFHSEPLSEKQLRAIHVKIDSNSDGKIIMEEVLAIAAKQTASSVSTISEAFADSAIDKDGKVSLDERVKHMVGSMDAGEDEEMQHFIDEEKAKFKFVDTDGDGLLTLAEAEDLFSPQPDGPIFQLMAETSMKKLDLDGDGEIFAEEFWTPEHVDGELEETSEEQKEEFKAADKDKSGTLNIGEHKHWEHGGFHLEVAMKQLFEVSDADHDGSITADELAQSGEHLADEMGPSAHFHLTEWAKHNEL